MEVQNEYKVNIRMHTMVPDSLSWGKDPIANNPVSNTAEKQKVVIAWGQDIIIRSKQ